MGKLQSTEPPDEILRPIGEPGHPGLSDFTKYYYSNFAKFFQSLNFNGTNFAVL